MKAVIVGVAALLLAACGKTDSAGAPGEAPKPRPDKLPNGEPAVVGVRHILIGFVGSQQYGGTRTRQEADRLVEALVGKAKAAAADEKEFKKLMSEYSDDPGSNKTGEIYTLVNHGIEPMGNEAPRSGMVKGFADASFTSDVGEVRLVLHDPVNTPHGHHIILRVK